MFCVYCGKEIDEIAKFCPVCGKQIGRSENKYGAENIVKTGAETASVMWDGLNDKREYYGGSNPRVHTSRVRKNEYLALPELKELKKRIDSKYIVALVLGVICCFYFRAVWWNFLPLRGVIVLAFIGMILVRINLDSWLCWIVGLLGLMGACTSFMGIVVYIMHYCCYQPELTGI